MTDDASSNHRTAGADPRTIGVPGVEVPETEIVHTRKVACDGGEGALGHPRVWLTIPKETRFVECGYCDKRFILADDADEH